MEARFNLKCHPMFLDAIMSVFIYKMSISLSGGCVCVFLCVYNIHSYFYLSVFTRLCTIREYYSLIDNRWDGKQQCNAYVILTFYYRTYNSRFAFPYYLLLLSGINIRWTKRFIDLHRFDFPSQFKNALRLSAKTTNESYNPCLCCYDSKRVLIYFFFLYSFAK